MKTRKNIMRTLSMVLVLVSLFIMILPVGAAEPRTSTNGYSWTNVTYSGKVYTISIGIGGFSSYKVYSTISCPVAKITIAIGGVSAKYDTISYGYLTKSGKGRSVTSTESASENNPFTANSPNCESGISDSQIIRVLSADGSATFSKINNGADATISAHYAYVGS